jgi:hypothetical protein
MCLSKRFEEDYDDAIFVDESTIEEKNYNPTNWRKDQHPSLRAAGGKLGTPKHSFKVYLFGGISRKGLTPLIVFKGRSVAVISKIIFESATYTTAFLAVCQRHRYRY